MAKPWTAGWIKANVSDAAEYFIDSDYYELQERIAQLKAALNKIDDMAYERGPDDDCYRDIVARCRLAGLPVETKP